MILTIRTDSPQAEIGLYDGQKQKAYKKWLAGRDLSSDIHGELAKLLQQGHISFDNLTGVILYKGPGSFTGLRIGAVVANTISYELDIPIAGASGDDWISEGVKLLNSEPDRRVAELEYGAEPNVSRPKK